MTRMTFRVYQDHTGAWRWMAWSATKRTDMACMRNFSSRRSALANVRRIINAIRGDLCEIIEDDGKRTQE